MHLLIAYLQAGLSTWQQPVEVLDITWLDVDFPCTPSHPDDPGGRGRTAAPTTTRTRHTPIRLGPDDVGHGDAATRIGVTPMARTRGQFGFRGVRGLTAWVGGVDLGSSTSSPIPRVRSVHDAIGAVLPAAVAVALPPSTFGHDLIQAWVMIWMAGLAILACCSGGMPGATIPMVLGTRLAKLNPGQETAAGPSSAVGSRIPVMLPLLTIGLPAACSVCLHPVTLGTVAMIQTIVPTRDPDGRAGGVLAMLVTPVAAAPALEAGLDRTSSRRTLDSLG